jgi:hypothetical protein
MSHGFNTSLKDLEGEVWKAVEGYNGKYQISNKGRLKVYGKYGSPDKSRVDFIRPHDNGAGYYQVRMSKNGKTIQVRLHKLVAQYFLENTNNYPQLNHKDTDKSNNAADNLEYCTNQFNSIHSQENGLQGKRRFTYEIAEEIRKLKREGMKEAEIAKIYNTNYHYIRLIVTGVKWSNNDVKINNSKISKETVIEIKKKLKEGVRVCDISKLLDVKYGIIHGIKSNLTWTHINID